MHSGFNTVVHLKVKLGKLVGLIGRSFLDITKGGGIDNVADNEALDCLILGDGLSSRDAPVDERGERHWCKFGDDASLQYKYWYPSALCPTVTAKPSPPPIAN